MVDEASSKRAFDIFIEEWRQCRASIREFDSTLTHLRSYSVLATIALLAIGGFFAIATPPEPGRGLVIDTLALALLFAEYYLAKHYRGYLHATVNRAMKLEEVLMNQFDSPTIEFPTGEKTDRMISGVIGVQREWVYGFLVAEAHNLLYLLLFGVDGALIVFTLFLFGTGLSPIIPALIGVILFSIGIYFLAIIRVGWKNRLKPSLIFKNVEVEHKEI
jgi:hypothetical protein